jgi:hypothetical protein
MLPVYYANIISYFSSLCIFCRDKYVTLEVADFRSTADTSGSPACEICGQDELNEKCEGVDLSFSSALTTEGTLEA